MAVLDLFQKQYSAGRKAIAVLLDPDRIEPGDALRKQMELIRSASIDYVFIGGSLITDSGFDVCIQEVKRLSNVPVVLFPGSVSQLTPSVDAVLFLSLISGRNPELLIGQHVIAAPIIRELNLEAISTGYMLVDCGTATTASYMSGTLPLPYDKPGIAAATASAGELLGMSCMYLDGGSGAAKPVSPEMIRAVRKSTSTPLIVGGGMNSQDDVKTAFGAGADIAVVGTAIERNLDFLFDLHQLKKEVH